MIVQSFVAYGSTSESDSRPHDEEENANSAQEEVTSH